MRDDASGILSDAGRKLCVARNKNACYLWVDCHIVNLWNPIWLFWRIQCTSKCQLLTSAGCFVSLVDFSSPLLSHSIFPFIRWMNMRESFGRILNIMLFTTSKHTCLRVLPVGCVVYQVPIFALSLSIGPSPFLSYQMVCFNTPTCFYVLSAISSDYCSVVSRQSRVYWSSI